MTQIRLVAVAAFAASVLFLAFTMGKISGTLECIELRLQQITEVQK